MYFCVPTIDLDTGTPRGNPNDYMVHISVWDHNLEETQLIGKTAIDIRDVLTLIDKSDTKTDNLCMTLDAGARSGTPLNRANCSGNGTLE